MQTRDRRWQEASGERRPRPRPSVATCGLLALLLLAPVSGGLLAGPPQPSTVIAIVTHKKSPVSNLTRAELRDIFLKRRQVWPSGATIVPINSSLDSPLKKAFDQQVLGMSAQELGNYWVKEAVTGRSTPPRRVGTSALAKQLVAAVPGAVTYLELTRVDATVKVIAVDGLQPTNPKYKYRFQSAAGR